MATIWQRAVWLAREGVLLVITPSSCRLLEALARCVTGNGCWRRESSWHSYLGRRMVKIFPWRVLCVQSHETLGMKSDLGERGFRLVLNRLITLNRILYFFKGSAMDGDIRIERFFPQNSKSEEGA